MPLSINVGLSRKASKNYQSTGVSINVTAELDQALLAKPEELQQQIDDLYAQAEQAIQRQVQSYAGPTAGQPRPANGPARPRNGATTPARLSTRSNGHDNGRSTPAGATESQRRAIDAIAQRLDLDAVAEVQQEFGLDLDRLTIRQASQVIDHLKALSPRPRNGA